MARILTPEQFRECPKGTVFSYGVKWAFRQSVFVLDTIIELSHGSWGFYAFEPSNAVPDFETLERCLRDGSSFRAEPMAIKYMDYMDGPFEVFMVFEKPDWEELGELVTFPSSASRVAA